MPVERNADGAESHLFTAREDVCLQCGTRNKNTRVSMALTDMHVTAVSVFGYLQ